MVDQEEMDPPETKAQKDLKDWRADLFQGEMGAMVDLVLMEVKAVR